MTIERHRPYSLKSQLLALAVLGFILLLLIALEGPVNAFLQRFISNLRSEYGLLEQLSKYYLLVSLLVSIHAYGRPAGPRAAQLSIGFLLLAITMYLAESNMITETAQPLFAALLLLPIFWALFRERAWLPLLLALAGAAFISGGVVVDFLKERAALQAWLGESAVLFVESRLREEMLDLVGIAALCAAAIIYFRDTAWPFANRQRLATAGYLLGLGPLAFGNGFLHFQYAPDERFRGLGLLISLTGFVTVVLVNRFLAARESALELMSEEFFYLFLFTFFVMLPAVFAKPNLTISLVLWLPALAGLGLLLFARRPATLSGH